MVKGNKSNKSNKKHKSNKSNKDINRINKDIIENEKNNSYYSITNITFITDVLEPKTIAEKIRSHLFINPNQTIKQISDSLNIDTNKIKTIIQSQNKDLFYETDKKGKEKIYDITPIERNNINFLVEQKKKQLEKEREDKIKQDLQKRNDENTIFKIKEIFNDIFIRDNEITLDLKKLKEEDPEIFDRLENSPDDIIDKIKLVLEDKGLNKNFCFKALDQIQTKTIENLRTNDVNRLLVIEGKSTSQKNVRFQTIRITFECPSCGTHITVIQEGRFIREPKRCSCGRKGQFNILSKIKEDFCEITIEDLQDKSELSSTKNIRGVLRNRLTSNIEIKKSEPGNDLLLLGVLRENPDISNGKVTLISEGFFEILEIEPFESEITIEDFEEEDIKQFNELCSEIDNKGLKIIRSSIAPQIYGHEDIKDALILQLSQPKNDLKEIRNKSNILLLGDPGTAKTILMKYIRDITTRCKWTVGSGSSKVGLTATVEKEDEGYKLKPGALVLAKELTIIDELNNISDSEKPLLQEAMTEQKISINKASIQTSLKVTGGILSSANPIFGEFKEDQDLIKQFNLMPQIMNRFDFIFILKDLYDYNTDLKISEKMFEQEKNIIKVKYDKSFLKKFFLYIRTLKDPEYPESLKEYICNLYADIRKLKGKIAKINPRFMEALLRCSKSNARLRNSNVVEKKDIEQVFTLLKNSYIKYLNDYPF